MATDNLQAESVPVIPAATYCTANALDMLLDEHPDAKLAAALFDWRRAAMEYEAHPINGDDDAQSEALLCTAESIQALLMGIPATTVEGLAIKSYMALHYELGASVDGYMLIDFDGGLMIDDGISRNLVDNALRLSPLLALAIVGERQ